MGTFLASVGIVAFLILLSGIKIVREYERGVIFRLGRLVGARGPGIFYVWPIIEQMVKVELRIVTLDIPRQEVITRDNVTISVNAVLYFRVYDPEDAIVQIQDFLRGHGRELLHPRVACRQQRIRRRPAQACREVVVLPLALTHHAHS